MQENETFLVPIQGTQLSTRRNLESCGYEGLHGPGKPTVASRSTDKNKGEANTIQVHAKILNCDIL
jgi:hypothetical protein